MSCVCTLCVCYDLTHVVFVLPRAWDESTLSAPDPTGMPLSASQLQTCPEEQHLPMLCERLQARVLPSAPSLGNKVMIAIDILQ